MHPAVDNDSIPCAPNCGECAVGSILEVLVSGPIQALTAEHAGGIKENCYCAKGSYTGLVFGLTALLWLFGPGVAFLALREKLRRQRGEHKG